MMAGAADLAALRRALQPVYDRLEREPRRKPRSSRSEAMRSAATPVPDAPTCSDPGSSQSAAGQATPIDGVYRVHTTAKELLAAGSSPTPHPRTTATSRWTLDRGRFTQKQPLGYTVGHVHRGRRHGHADNDERCRRRVAKPRRRALRLPLEPVPRPAHVRARQRPDLARALPASSPGGDRRRAAPACTHGQASPARPRPSTGRLPPAHHRGGPTRKPIPTDELLPENYGGFEMALDRGRFTQAQPPRHHRGRYVHRRPAIMVTLTVHAWHRRRRRGTAPVRCSSTAGASTATG